MNEPRDPNETIDAAAPSGPVDSPADAIGPSLLRKARCARLPDLEEPARPEEAEIELLKEVELSQEQTFAEPVLRSSTLLTRGTMSILNFP